MIAKSKNKIKTIRVINKDPLSIKCFVIFMIYFRINIERT